MCANRQLLFCIAPQSTQTFIFVSTITNQEKINMHPLSQLCICFVSSQQASFSCSFCNMFALHCQFVQKIISIVIILCLILSANSFSRYQIASNVWFVGVKAMIVYCYWNSVQSLFAISVFRISPISHTYSHMICKNLHCSYIVCIVRLLSVCNLFTACPA